MLVERLKKIYEDTNSVVRTSEGTLRKRSTRKRLKQECVLSPLLFSLYVADIHRYVHEKERDWRFEFRKGEGIEFSVRADDMVLVAKN